MKKRVFLILLTFVLLFLCSCGEKEQALPAQTEAGSQDYPLMVAEKAWSYLRDDQNIDAFMDLSPYSQNSSFHNALQKLATEYIRETMGCGDWELQSISKLDYEDASEIATLLSASGIENVTDMQYFEFSNSFDNGKSESFDVLVGKKDQKWYILSIEYWTYPAP